MSDERGVALVETAIVAPVFVVMIFGMLSGGILYNQQMQMTHSAREGARYGVTVSETQPFASGGWVDNVRAVVVERAGGELTTGQVCVALVKGAASPPEVVSTTSGTNTTYHSSNGAQPCFDDSAGNEHGRRVQVLVRKPGTLDAVFFKYPVDLTARATARHEFK